MGHFHVYDMGDVPGDRYTIVDIRPIRIRDQNIRFFFGFNAHPFHPWLGIGQHGEFNEKAWREVCADEFRSLGRPIELEDLPPEALRAAKQFIRAQEAP